MSLANKRMLMVFTFLISLTIVSSFASADTVVLGKIYNSDFSNGVANAQVTVTCQGIVLNNTTKSDGTYAADFTSGCAEGSTVTVNAFDSSTSKSGSDHAAVSQCSGNSQCGNYTDFAVVNINVNPQLPNDNSGTGGSGGGYTVVKNNKNSSSQNVTSQNVSTTSSTSNSGVVYGSAENNTQSQNSTTSSAPITGGVIGALGTGTWIVIVVLVLAIVVFYFIVRRNLKQTQNVPGS